MPLYPGDCNPPSEQSPVYPSSVLVPQLPITLLPTDPTSPITSQDKWTSSENEKEVKIPNKLESGAESPLKQEPTRPPTLVVFSDDDGLDVKKGGTMSERTSEELANNRNENRKVDKNNAQQWEVVVRNATQPNVSSGHKVVGKDDPLLSPGSEVSMDETNSSWQPFTNDGPSNSLSPDGSGSREDAARAFVDPGEVSDGIGKRPPKRAAASQLASTNGSSTNKASFQLPEWRPRHIPIYGTSAYEPRSVWHPEMAPPELDPPPIHAPLTWQHWIGFEDNKSLRSGSTDGRTDVDGGTSTTNSSESTETTTPSSAVQHSDALSTPASINTSTAVTPNASADWGTSGGPFAPVVETVQLLPQRLAAFLARAEEYARVTLSGMVLGMAAPEANNSSETSSRKPKYFPPMLPEVEEGTVVVPSKATSVGAMGRGQAQYYSRRAIVGQGSERSFDTEGSPGVPLHLPRKTQEAEGIGDSAVSEGKAVEVVVLPLQQSLEPASYRGRRKIIQQRPHGEHPRYIPLRRPPVQDPASRRMRVGPLPSKAFIMPRR